MNVTLQLDWLVRFSRAPNDNVISYDQRFKKKKKKLWPKIRSVITSIVFVLLVIDFRRVISFINFLTFFLSYWDNDQFLIIICNWICRFTVILLLNYFSWGFIIFQHPIRSRCRKKTYNTRYLVAYYNTTWQMSVLRNEKQLEFKQTCY